MPDTATIPAPTLLRSGPQPTGTVTFLFTDVESSTRWWATKPQAMSAALRTHDEVLRSVIQRFGGYVFATAGDSYGVAFARSSDGVAAAVAIQDHLANARWDDVVLRVRIGLHLGEAEERDGDYFGAPVNTAARVCAAGHGGQILLTDLVRSTVDVATRDLGVHQLRGVPEPIRILQVGDETLPPLRVVEVGGTNLPARPTRLFGREDDVSAARQSLHAGRLLTITGLGGTGKTRVAIAIGEEELAHRPGGVWFVDLTKLTNGREIPRAVCAAMGLQVSGVDADEALFRNLAERHALLILDNCEHLIEDCAEFAERFLSTRSESVMVATSREKLDIDGERTLMLRTLDSVGADSSAVRLFVDRATAADPSFGLDDSNTAAVADLCSHLDGLPLAIELAAARVTVMKPSELLAGLDDRFRLLGEGRRLRKQRTLDATLDWSYELLSDDQRRVFRSLGVFVGGFDFDAVNAVNAVDAVNAVNAVNAVDSPLGASGAPQIRELFDALIAKSLVARADVDDSDAGRLPTRFMLLETVKAYAERKLRAEGEEARRRDLHLAHYHRLVSARGRVMVPDVGVGARLRIDRGNLTAAFEWAASRDRWIVAGELLLGSLAAYGYEGALEAKSLFERCFEPLQRVDGELADYLSVSILLCLVLLDDWTLVRELAQVTTASSDPRCRVAGFGLLGLAMYPFDRPVCEEHLRTADRCLAEIEAVAVVADENTDLNADLARLWLMTAKANVPDYFTDLADVWSQANEVLDVERRNGHVTFLSLRASATVAVQQILSGDPGAAIETVETYARLTSQATFGDGILVFAQLARSEVGLARDLTRRHARRGAEGMLSRECNDSVVLLAALAHAEGDIDVAKHLLVRAGVCRQLAVELLGSDLASRMGFAKENLEAQRTARLYSRDDEAGVLGVRLAMSTLRNELARRGWA